MNLHQLLTALVLGSATAACGIGTSTSDCPHQVVDSEKEVAVSSDDACDLAAQSNGFTQHVSDPAACQRACSDSHIDTCFLPAIYLNAVTHGIDAGADGGSMGCPLAASTVKLTCEITHTEGTLTTGCPVNGRLTMGLRPRSVISSLATYLGHCAELEAISVESFRRLARELRAIGAPERFAERAERAALEEIGHTRSMTKLAAHFGAQAPVLAIPSLPLRSAFAIALENAVEGAVRETFGAAVALHQAHHARDAEVRRVHLRIAAEERAHAELALDLADYFRSVLSAEECAAIDDAQLTAIAELRRDLAMPVDQTVAEAAGLPSSKDALRIVDGLDSVLWKLPTRPAASRSADRWSEV